MLDERALIHQMSDADAIDELAANKKLIAYIGYDCTADSLHIGNLVSILLLRRLQQSGNKPIIILGGGTTKIGDPSGRDESRKILSPADIAHNKKRIAENFSAFLQFGEGATDAIMVDNDEWLSELNYIELLRDVGPHFSVNRMLSFDSVRLRLEREQNLSFIEFNYMILQAYDYVELHKRYGCNLQMGGSDQWGNIINGIELGRRSAGLSLYGLTAPLMTTASGAKMGKSVNGAVWLSADKIPPYDYWQYWRNTEDNDVARFLKIFTELPASEIARLEQLQGSELNDAKKILATEATAMCHGRAAAQEAETAAHKLFEQGQKDTNMPSVSISKTTFMADGLGLLDAVRMAGLVASNGEARRHIQGGALKVNDITQQDMKKRLSMDDVNDEAIKISLGKKKHILLTLDD